jgi:hypothetical protein
MIPASPAQSIPQTFPGRTANDRPASFRETAPIGNSIQIAQRRDHRFFMTMAILAAAWVFVGYSQTYYLKAWVPSPQLATLIHIHAAAFTTYLLFYILQTALVSRRRVALHMTFGWASVVLIPIMVLLGTAAVFWSAKQGHKVVWPDVEIAAAVNLGDGYTFAVLAAAGIFLRKKPQAHKRLMLTALYGGLIPPAIERTPLHNVVPAMFGTIFAFLLAGPVYDLVTRRRIHPAYLWSLLFIAVFFIPTRIAIGSTAFWHHFVDWVIR